MSNFIVTTCDDAANGAAPRLHSENRRRVRSEAMKEVRRRERIERSRSMFVGTSCSLIRLATDIANTQQASTRRRGSGRLCETCVRKTVLSMAVTMPWSFLNSLPVKQVDSAGGLCSQCVRTLASSMANGSALHRLRSPAMEQMQLLGTFLNTRPQRSGF